MHNRERTKTGDFVCYRGELTSKRVHDTRIHNHNPETLRIWRANTDMSILTDLYKVKKYVTKYASKPETKSKLFTSAATALFLNENALNIGTPKLLRRVMIKGLANRDIAVMEAIHQLMSWPLHKSNITVINIDLMASRNLEKDSSGSIKYNDSLVDFYAKRTDNLTMNMIEFATKFKIVLQKLARRFDHTHIAIRFFQKFSNNPDNEHYWQHCKFQLLRYKPWIKKHENALINDINNDKEDWIQSWKHFQNSDDGQKMIPKWYELNQIANQKWNVQNSYPIEMMEMDQDQLNCVDTEEQEDYMILANETAEFDKNQKENTNNSVNPLYFDEERKNFDTDLLAAMPKWMGTEKQKASTVERTFPPVDISKLNIDQMLGYNIVKNHFDKTPKEQLLLRLQGQGGTLLI